MAFADYDMKKSTISNRPSGFMVRLLIRDIVIICFDKRNVLFGDVSSEFIINEG